MPLSAPNFNELPHRVFDLLPYYLDRFSDRKCLFASIKGGEKMEYDGRRFCELTDRLSMALLRLGLRKGDKVTLIAASSPQWHMIDFATMQIGAILVPIYPNISVNEFDYILEHSESKVVFVDSNKTFNKHKESITRHIDSVHFFYINEGCNPDYHINTLLNQEPDPELEALLKATELSISPDDIATIIYTSGTSGIPKGVMLSHENIMSDIKHYGPLFPNVQTVISFLPLSHIFERSGQLTRIFYGISMYYVESTATIMRDIADVKPEEFSTIPRLVEKIYDGIQQKGSQLKGLKKNIFTWAFRLADQYDETGRHNSRLYLKKLALARKLVFNEVLKVFGGRLKLIISGGAPIQPRLVKVFAAMGCPILEGYGMTEASPVISTCSYNPMALKAGTVGIPLANVQIKFDPDTSEILVKGPMVMKGYYKNEELTRQSFDEEGYFRTGDKGYLDEDGFLVLNGRLKEQFKSSMGKFISPSALENKLHESPWINNVIVVGEFQKYAAALIVPNFEQLRLWCKENGIPYTTNAEMVGNSKVLTRIRQEVDKSNLFFGESEQIGRFKLLDHEWTIESGELTPSLKTRRPFIMEKYKAEINGLFE